MGAASPGDNSGDDLQEHGGTPPLQETPEAVPVPPSTQQVTWVAETWGFDGQRHISFGVGF
jgi:hypothetical protein